jgi:aryl-alcohol dehydrogenase-like predicted oxidoreductase
MKKRHLGKTGLFISEISLGTSQMGGKYEDVHESDAIKTIETYLEAGGNCIDTAVGYGSEKYIGQVLSGIPRNDLVLVTKTANTKNLDQVPSMWRDLETSLKHLRTDWIDVYLMHSPPDDTRTIEAVLSEMRKMKEQGYIRHIGASIKGHNVTDDTVNLCKRYMDYEEMDVFEIIYSILRQKLNYSGIIEECRQRGIGLLARTVLEGGFLTEKYPLGYRFSTKDHRANYSIEQLNKILLAGEALKSRLPSNVPDLTTMAVQFVLANHNISTAILGAKTAEQIKKLVNASLMDPLPPEILRKLELFGLHQTEEYNLK